MKEKNNFFGTCSICLLPNKSLATTKTISGSMTYWIKKACDHCQMVIQLDIDHTRNVLRADSFEERHKKENQIAR